MSQKKVLQEYQFQEASIALQGAASKNFLKRSMELFFWELFFEINKKGWINTTFVGPSLNNLFWMV